MQRANHQAWRMVLHRSGMASTWVATEWPKITGFSSETDFAGRVKARPADRNLAGNGRRRALEDREFAPKQAERNLSEIYLGLGSSTLRYNERGLLSVCSKPSYARDPNDLEALAKGGKTALQSSISG